MNGTVLINGAASACGSAIAHAFAGAGWSIVLVDPCQDALDQLGSDLPRKTDLHMAVVDGRDIHGFQAVVSNLPEQFRHVDSVVNAATVRHWPISTCSSLADDLIGMLNLTEALMPMLKDSGGQSSIVNIGLKGSKEEGSFVDPMCKIFSHNLRRGLVGSSVRVEDIALDVEEELLGGCSEQDLARKVLTIAQSTPATRR